MNTSPDGTPWQALATQRFLLEKSIRKLHPGLSHFQAAETHLSDVNAASPVNRINEEAA